MNLDYDYFKFLGEYDSTLEYDIGDMCTINGEVYVYTTKTTTEPSLINIATTLPFYTYTIEKEFEPRICKQCGAPLYGNVCEYCGTRY